MNLKDSLQKRNTNNLLIGHMFLALMSALLFSSCAGLKQDLELADQQLQSWGKSADKKLRHWVDPVNNSKTGSVSLDVNTISIKPSKTVHRGKKMTVIVQYTLQSTAKSNVAVTETKSLWRKGKCVKVIDTETLQRSIGKWESSATFQIPKSADKGQYQFRQDFNSDVFLKMAMIEFTVL